MNKHVLGGLILGAILLVLSAILTIFKDISLLESLRIFFGSVYVLFVPGYVISYIFFPKNKYFDSEDKEGAIDWLERIALSFALSIAIVPLVVFYLNLAGVRISALNSAIIILVIILVSFGILKWKSRNQHK